MPIVLVFNEEKATDAWVWDDKEGARHHFPNTYKNMVIPGERFVYCHVEGGPPTSND
jgi:hypothetical protein